MTIPYVHGDRPYFSYDCYTWCHPKAMDFGDFVNLDQLVYKGRHHLVPFYVRCMCALARALGIVPAYLPTAGESSLPPLPENDSVDEFCAYYNAHLKGLLHPDLDDMRYRLDPMEAIFRDFLPLRKNLIDVIRSTNWRGEGENNAPYYFESWTNTELATQSKAFLEDELPVLKKGLVPHIATIDRLVFQGLFPKLTWSTVSLDELMLTWAYPDPKRARDDSDP